MAAPNPTTLPSRALSLKTVGFLIFPVLLLAGVILLFLSSNGAGLNVRPVVPVESLSIERTVLKPGTIELHLRNTSPQDLRIAQVVINDAFWKYEAAPGSTLPQAGQRGHHPPLSLGGG